MAGRPTQKKADIEALQRLVVNTDGVVDYKPIIANVMRHCGCTYTEIAEVFGISRQMAESIFKSSEGKGE